MEDFTAEERERLRALVRADRYEKAIACLDELGSPHRIKDVIAGLSENSDAAGELRAVARLVRWIRWTREGIIELRWWIAGGVATFWFFRDDLRTMVLQWLGGDQ